MAAGRFDADVTGIGSALAVAFAGEDAGNPFREIAARGRTPEEEEAESKRAFAMIGAGLRGLAGT